MKKMMIELAVATALMVVFHYVCVMTGIKLYDLISGAVCVILTKDLIKEAKK